ncbi:MAG: YCF48-related protein [Thermodesulfobacteriota bacterium]|nr:YCF48-related protein [Thermodesulfobacteriota bacterium]
MVFLVRVCFVFLLSILLSVITVFHDRINHVYAETKGIAPYYDDMNDVKILDYNIWAAGSYGTILYSGDRGEKWVIQDSNTRRSLFGISGVDSQRLWVVGAYGTILCTEDGGEIWKRLESTTDNHLFAVQFIDSKEGWAVGNYSTILHTNDGGINWEDQSLGKDLQLYSVYFVDCNNGWVAGEFGVIYYTKDGGKIWKKQQSGIEVDITSESVQCLFKVYFNDLNKGWACGLDGIILKTLDGGTTWEIVRRSGKNHLLDIIFKDGRIFGVGMRGTIISRKVKESKWEDYECQIKRHLNAIDFWGELGIIVGCGGTIFRTEAGNYIWKLLKPVERVKR